MESACGLRGTNVSELKEREWIAIARLLRPQGRKGEVLAELLTDRMSEFRAGRPVRLEKSAPVRPAPREGVLHEHWMPMGKNAGRIVLKLEGVDSISGAELLAGFEVMVPAAELEALDADTFYVKDLLGCTLLNGTEPVGLVVDVQFATSTDGRVRLEDAAPLLAVEGQPGADPVLVPFVKAYLREIDIAGKRIVMELPDGLFAFGDEAPDYGEDAAEEHGS